MTQEKLIAGIELGGTKCVALLATGPTDVRDRVTVPTTDPVTTLAALDGALRELEEDLTRRRLKLWEDAP